MRPMSPRSLGEQAADHPVTGPSIVDSASWVSTATTRYVWDVPPVLVSVQVRVDPSAVRS